MISGFGAVERASAPGASTTRSAPERLRYATEQARCRGRPETRPVVLICFRKPELRRSRNLPQSPFTATRGTAPSRSRRGASNSSKRQRPLGGWRRGDDEIGAVAAVIPPNPDFER